MVFGEITQPPPMPADQQRPGAAANPAEPGGTSSSTSAVAASPTTTPISPATVSRRPNRSTSRPPITADAAEPSANGVTASPDCSGV